MTAERIAIARLVIVALLVLLFLALAWISVFVALASRAAETWRDDVDPSLRRRTLTEYRDRAKARTANIPRPDPAKCGTRVRHPLPPTTSSTGQTTHVGWLQQLERNAGRRDRPHFPYS